MGYCCHLAGIKDQRARDLQVLNRMDLLSILTVEPLAAPPRWLLMLSVPAPLSACAEICVYWGKTG